MLEIAHPIVQAPIGSAATPELAAAVAEAGGLGSLALTWVSPEEARARIRRVRALTNRPFAANVVLSFDIDEVLAACLDERVPIVSTFWGDPAGVNKRIRDSGARHIHTIGSVDEALRAVESGVDAVVAQGWEAGGHVRGRVATMALVPAVVDAVSPVPVIAAGGIADGRGLAAVLALGAQAGWLGTRFLTAYESAAHAVYRQRVLAAAGEDAEYTSCFDGGWPDAPHRVLENSTLRDWRRAGCPDAPGRPGEADVIATAAGGRQHLRYSQAAPIAGVGGDPGAMALYAGQSAGLVGDCAPAGEIVARVVAQAAQ
jgi:NAD(P)H-dependent flavin oxidoreductase YrpB (nitropropane dioxygenase family)